MSNIVIEKIEEGWSWLEQKLHFHTELAHNNAGPDGAKASVKANISKVISDLKAAGYTIAAPVIAEAEAAAPAAVGEVVKAAEPVLEDQVGEPSASVIEAGLEASAQTELNVAEGEVNHALEGAAPSEAGQ